MKVKMFVRKTSDVYQDLKELKRQDDKLGVDISVELVKDFGDNWSITCDHIGKPEYIHSTTVEVEGWHKREGEDFGENEWVPNTPSKLWEKGFKWYNDAISKIICGEAVYIMVDKNTLIRGFKVSFVGKHIFLEFDKRLLKHVTLKNGLKEVK